MALKPLHGVAAVIASCALVAIGLLPAAPASRQWNSVKQPEPLVARNRLSLEARTAIREWHSAAQRDSILAVLERLSARPANAPLVLTQDVLTPKMRDAAVAMIMKRWEELEIDSLRVPVTVVVLADTLRPDERHRYESSAGVEYLLPADSGPNRSKNSSCMVVIRLGRRSESLKLLAESLGQHADTYFAGNSFGPCAFISAFGMPGPGIAQWLSSRRYDVSVRATWSGQHRVQEGDWEVSALGSRWWFPLGSDIHETNLTGRKCLLGSAAACEETLLQPLRITPNDRSAERYLMDASLQSAWRDSPYLLSDLLREMGRDRFGKFWNSSAGPAKAFEGAMGIPFGDWALHWVRQNHGSSVGGAGLPASRHLSGLMIALCCVGFAATVAHRRQVSR